MQFRRHLGDLRPAGLQQRHHRLTGIRSTGSGQHLAVTAACRFQHREQLAASRSATGTRSRLRPHSRVGDRRVPGGRQCGERRQSTRQSGHTVAHRPVGHRRGSERAAVQHSRDRVRRLMPRSLDPAALMPDERSEVWWIAHGVMPFPLTTTEAARSVTMPPPRLCSTRSAGVDAGCSSRPSTGRTTRSRRPNRRRWDRSEPPPPESMGVMSLTRWCESRCGRGRSACRCTCRTASHAPSLSRWQQAFGSRGTRSRLDSQRGQRGGDLVGARRSRRLPCNATGSGGVEGFADGNGG